MHAVLVDEGERLRRGDEYQFLHGDEQLHLCRGDELHLHQRLQRGAEQLICQPVVDAPPPHQSVGDAELCQRRLFRQILAGALRLLAPSPNQGAVDKQRSKPLEIQDGVGRQHQDGVAQRTQAIQPTPHHDGGHQLPEVLQIFGGAQPPWATAVKTTCRTTTQAMCPSRQITATVVRASKKVPQCR
jgi:hypothetical protein